MSLHWPWALTALLAFPLLLAYRWWTRRRRRREAVRLSSVTLIRAALPGRSLWRRRIPLWLFAVGLVVLATGAARPQATVPVPANQASILLAMDVSASMCSTDVKPNRIAASQAAAKDFVELWIAGADAHVLRERTDDRRHPRRSDDPCAGRAVQRRARAPSAGITKLRYFRQVVAKFSRVRRQVLSAVIERIAADTGCREAAADDAVLFENLDEEAGTAKRASTR